MPRLKENGDESLEITLKCHKIIGGYGQGEALVSNEPICFYLTDPKTGIVREKSHELAGKNLANKVLVFPSGKASSVVQIDGLFKLASNNVAPEAMIVKDVETVLVVSAFIAKVPLVDRLEKDPFEVIRTGDFVKVDAEKGLVRIAKQEVRRNRDVTS
jgi:predicted aconitase with swiveling domain